MKWRMSRTGMMKMESCCWSWRWDTRWQWLDPRWNDSPELELEEEANICHWTCLILEMIQSFVFNIDLGFKNTRFFNIFILFCHITCNVVRFCGDNGIVHVVFDNSWACFVAFVPRFDHVSIFTSIQWFHYLLKHKIGLKLVWICLKLWLIFFSIQTHSCRIKMHHAEIINFYPDWTIYNSK